MQRKRSLLALYVRKEALCVLLQLTRILSDGVGSIFSNWF